MSDLPLDECEVPVVCPNWGRPPEELPSFGEQLVCIANWVRQPTPRQGGRKMALLPAPAWDHGDLAMVKFALDFVARGNAFVLRAIVEDWDMQRIQREVYV